MKAERIVSSRIVFVCIAALVAIAGLGPHAAGQGTSGTLPDPISTTELMQYAERLGLSDEQFRAVESMHDQYREEFRRLREGEITEFLERMRELQGAGMRMPEREKIEAFIEDWEKISGRIKQVDVRFLSGISTVLTDRQQPHLQRVILARERKRHNAAQMMGFGGQPVDLSELLLEIPLAAAEQQNIDPTMAGYESRLTQLMREVSERGRTMMLEFYDAAEAAGLDENAMEDPEQAQRMMEVMQEAFGRITARLREKTSEIAALNRRTFDQIRPLLSERAATALRDRFIRGAYPQAAFALQSETIELCDTALAMDAVPAGTKEEVRAIRIDHAARREAMIDKAIEVVEQLQAFSPFDFNSEERRTTAEKLGELQSQVAQRDAEGRRTLELLLGEAVFPTLQAKRAEAAEEQDGSSSSAAVVAGNVAARTSELQTDEPRPGLAGDEYLPGPITEYDIAIYADVLRLSEGERILLEDLHEQYRQTFEAQTAELAKSLQKASAERWAYDEESGTVAGQSAEKIDRMFDLRREAAAAIRKLDESFFNDIDLTLFPDEPSPRVAMVRHIREIDQFNRGGSATFMFGRRRSTPANLFTVVREMRLGDTAWLRIEGPLAAYLEQFADALKSLYAVHLEIARENEIWQAEIMRRQQEDDFNPMEMGMEYQERMRDSQAKMAESIRAIADITETSFHTLYNALDPDTAHRFQQSYRERAYPNVYHDPASPELAIRAAMRLEELSTGQRSSLAEITAEFRTRYAELSDQMVEHARQLGRQAIVSFEPEDWQVFQEHQNAMAKLRFDRNELNARTINRLRSLLRPEQIERIGGLPEPPKDSDEMWFME